MKVNKRKQVGLSLIEILISLAISSVILAGVVNSFVTTKKVYLYSDQMSYIQDSARYALDIIARDLRQAGYMGGCNYYGADVANTVENSVPQASFLNSTLPVEGYEGGVDVFPAEISAEVWNATTNPDAVVIRGMDDDLNLTVTSSHPATSSNLIVNTNDGVEDGDVLLLVSSDCSQVAIFAVTATPSGVKIQHNPGSSGNSTNCTKKLSGNFDCSDVDAGNYKYPAGSKVHRLKAKAFYVSASIYDDSVPALYQKEIGKTGEIVDKELVAGVENLQITYGVDTEADSLDGKANIYLAANEINSYKADAASAWVGWDRVVNAKISVQIRSREQVNQEVDQTYGDRYLRKTITSTIKLRNSALPGNRVPK